jgi:hypothetical protein
MVLRLTLELAKVYLNTHPHILAISFCLKDEFSVAIWAIFLLAPAVSVAFVFDGCSLDEDDPLWVSGILDDVMPNVEGASRLFGESANARTWPGGVCDWAC